MKIQSIDLINMHFSWSDRTSQNFRTYSRLYEISHIQSPQNLGENYFCQIYSKVKIKITIEKLSEGDLPNVLFTL